MFKQIQIFKTCALLSCFILFANVNARNETNEITWILDFAVHSICVANINPDTQISVEQMNECKEKHIPKVTPVISNCLHEIQSMNTCISDCFEDANNLFLQYDDPEEAMREISTEQQKCVSSTEKDGCLDSKKIEPMIKCISENANLRQQRRLLELYADLSHKSHRRLVQGTNIDAATDFVETDGERSTRRWGNAITVGFGLGAGVVGAALGFVVGLVAPFVLVYAMAIAGNLCCFCLGCNCVCSGTGHDMGFTSNGKLSPVVHTVAHIASYVGAVVGAVVGSYYGVIKAQDLKVRTVKLAQLQYLREGKKLPNGQPEGYFMIPCLFRNAHCNIERRGWFYFESMAKECCIGGYKEVWKLPKYYYYCKCWNGEIVNDIKADSKCHLCLLPTPSPTRSPTRSPPRTSRATKVPLKIGSIQNMSDVQD